MAGRSFPSPNPDHNHHRRQVVARDCHSRVQKTEFGANACHAVLCVRGGGRPAADRWAGQARLGGVQTAAWQILRHQPGGAITFDPLLPQVSPVSTVQYLGRLSRAYRGQCLQFGQDATEHRRQVPPPLRSAQAVEQASSTAGWVTVTQQFRTGGRWQDR